MHTREAILIMIKKIGSMATGAIVVEKCWSKTQGVVPVAKNMGGNHGNEKQKRKSFNVVNNRSGKVALFVPENNSISWAKRCLVGG